MYCSDPPGKLLGPTSELLRHIFSLFYNDGDDDDDDGDDDNDGDNDDDDDDADDDMCLPPARAWM